MSSALDAGELCQPVGHVDVRTVQDPRLIERLQAPGGPGGEGYVIAIDDDP